VLDHLEGVECPKLFHIVGLPKPIPKEFDPDEERKRLKRGGCCDPPREV
jgi:hypothetical protein